KDCYPCCGDGSCRGDETCDTCPQDCCPNPNPDDPCKNVKCPSDGYIGNPYCKNGDLYQIYRDYYCENGECKYTDTEIKIKDCEEGCSNEGCIVNPIDNDPDQDGVPNDGTDWCPEIKGHPLNHGCPRCPEVPENYGYDDCKWYEYLIRGEEGHLSYLEVEIKAETEYKEELKDFKRKYYDIATAHEGAALILGFLEIPVAIEYSLIGLGIAYINEKCIDKDIDKAEDLIDELKEKWWGMFDYANTLRVQANSCAFCDFEIKRPPEKLPWEE
ncbi:hypothetical protein DRN58_09440, partial [Thermococci archaeon]